MRLVLACTSASNLFACLLSLCAHSHMQICKSCKLTRVASMRCESATGKHYCIVRSGRQNLICHTDCWLGSCCEQQTHCHNRGCSAIAYASRHRLLKQERNEHLTVAGLIGTTTTTCDIRLSGAESLTCKLCRCNDTRNSKARDYSAFSRSHAARSLSQHFFSITHCLRHCYVTQPA